MPPSVVHHKPEACGPNRHSHWKLSRTSFRTRLSLWSSRFHLVKVVPAECHLEGQNLHHHPAFITLSAPQSVPESLIFRLLNPKRRKSQSGSSCGVGDLGFNRVGSIREVKFSSGPDGMDLVGQVRLMDLLPL